MIPGRLSPITWSYRNKNAGLYWNRGQTKSRLPLAEGNWRLSGMPSPNDSSGDMLPEYDFCGGIRGKYAGRFANDTITVVLDPDEDDDKETA